MSQLRKEFDDWAELHRRQDVLTIDVLQQRLVNITTIEAKGRSKRQPEERHAHYGTTSPEYLRVKATRNDVSVAEREIQM
jgi:hypothetical protein